MVKHVPAPQDRPDLFQDHGEIRIGPGTLPSGAVFDICLRRISTAVIAVGLLAAFTSAHGARFELEEQNQRIIQVASGEEWPGIQKALRESRYSAAEGNRPEDHLRSGDVLVYLAASWTYRI